MERKSSVIDLPQITVSHSEDPREHKRQYSRRYYAEHIKEQKQRAKQYRIKYAKEIKVKKAKYYHKRTIYYNLKSREWRKNHPDYRRQRYHREHDRIIARLGGKCQKCGSTDKRVLQIDHVNSNGYQEKKELGESGIIVRLLNLDDTALHANYQILCANCNWIKRLEIDGLKQKR